MTEEPDTAPEPVAAAETPAKPGRRRRSLLRRIGMGVGLAVATVLVLLLATVVGGRIYLTSDAGRGEVVKALTDLKLSRYGRLKVEGLTGDLLSEFRVARLTVSDGKGVWLEANNLRVDWDFSTLLGRHFHAHLISAETIRVLRRPEIDAPDGKPPQPAAISIDIDKFDANVELLEGFSKEYGKWRLSGSADIPRFGAKNADVNAYSLNRPGDYLRLTATFGGKVDELRLNLRANEAQGGPIAGSLGYSPDQPFSAIALINGEIVDATVKTGKFTPLVVKGRYGKDGARVSGFADFSGSDLLEPFVKRIGRTARFGFAAIPDANRKGFQGVGWRFISENFNSNAQGLIRLSDRSAPDGVKLEVSTQSLTRLLGLTLGGPTVWSGTFNGDAATWTLTGRATMLAADIASYKATRVTGPLNVQVKDGRMDIDSDLLTNGGSTDGVIGALFGTAPHLKFEAQRMKDGAFLFEKLDLVGQALLVNGAGTRNLLGVLGFRGQARITDIGRIQPGASGQLAGAITASNHSGQPWKLTFDGRGAKVATGLAELDRLMGATPRVQFEGQMERELAIDRLLVTGTMGEAAAKGLMGFDGRLRLALNWNARGPFGVGPVAIDGAMTGDGALTGTLAEPRVDLTAGFDKVDAGPLKLLQTQLILSFRKGADASDGRVTVTSGSNYGPASASGSFFLGGKSIRLTDVDVDAGGVKAQGAISLSDSIPSSADLTFSARPGAFITSGSAEGRVRLTEGSGDDTAILDVTAKNARLTGSTITIRSLDLNGRGTLSRLPFTLAMDVGGDNPVQFNGTGVYARQGSGADAGQSVTLRGGGRVREIAFMTRNPAVIAISGDGKVARVDLNVGGGVLTGELRQDANAASINADLSAVELGSLAPDLRGSVTGKVSMRGSGDVLDGSANVTLNQIRSVDAPRGLAVDGTVNATLSNDVLHIVAAANDNTEVRANVDLTLPVEASAAPLRLAVVRTRAMSGTVSIQGQIQPIWDLFFGGERSLAGQVNGNATIAGTIAEPRINGRLDVKEGAFRDNATGLRLNGLTLASRFDDTTALIETFTANDGAGGTVTGDGRIGLREGSGSSFELALARFKIIDNDIAEARASGPITVVRGADGNITLTGQINIDEARIEANPPGVNGVVGMDVVEINRPGGDPPEEDTAKHRGPQFGLNIQLRSPRGDIRVIGRGLNVQMRVNAQVTGTIATPILSGNANVVRGDYEFAGKRFVFDDRGTVSLSTDPTLIRLNLSATRDDPTLTATIKVTGTAAVPKIELTSTPALPQDEILSQVLFGRSASQLSAFEAAQLASGVASLAGGGGFDVIGNLRELAGLDRLSFGGEASALTVAGGRYITDDVYLEIIGGGEGGAAVNVEWQVRRNLAISSKFGGTGDATLSIRWRRQSRTPGGRTDSRPNRGS